MFKYLPSDIQRIAALTLAGMLKELDTEIIICKPAKEMAPDFSESFVELNGEYLNSLCFTDISGQKSHEHAAQIIACALAHTIRQMSKQELH